jgi:hypothetical protein
MLTLAVSLVTSGIMSEKTVLEKIEDATGEASSISVDGMSQSSRSIHELIAADKYIQQKEAATAKPSRMGFRMGVFRSPEHF